MPRNSCRVPTSTCCAGGPTELVDDDTDQIFSDGATLQPPTISGSISGSAGYAIAPTIGVAA